MNLLGLLAFSAGTILMYSGIKNVDPRTVIKAALGMDKLPNSGNGLSRYSPGGWGPDGTMNLGNGATGVPSGIPGSPTPPDRLLGDGRANLPVRNA